MLISTISVKKVTASNTNTFSNVHHQPQFYIILYIRAYLCFRKKELSLVPTT
jgi:hypothetical protein